MDYDKFTPRVNNTKIQKVETRPKEYSIWHRTLGVPNYAVDVDFVEWRPNRGIVAFMGVTGRLKDENHIINSKKYIWKRTQLERNILTDLSEKMKVPSFFVIHTEDLQVFHVHNLADDLDKFTKLNQEEYANFIRNL